MTTSRVDEANEADLRNWLVDYLVTTIGSRPEEIDLDAPLNQLGLGSRDAVVLARELSEMLGRPVSPVDFWENPTINSLAHGLLNVGCEPYVEPVPGSAPGLRERGWLDEPIAVVGLGCRLPGDVHGPDDFWQFLVEGRSAVGKVSDERWQGFDDGSAEVGTTLARTTRWGAFLDNVAAFDAQYFDISPHEAERIDPQQRLLLEVAVEALDHAGIPAESLRRTQTGVFAGACVSDYGFLASRDLGRIDAWTCTGGALSIIANRLSYFLDIRGPSVTVDTACSSSLVAIHLACKSLRTAESDLALAAGVNLVLSPAVTRGFDAAGAMSQSGVCRAFDAGADGFVRGEGCGVVVLKRLCEAVRDGNRVLAVVRGSAINQDGRSNGLMAPNPAAQAAVLRAACADAGVEPREVDYVEAHGTGTVLGDPIEARGLGSVYGRGRAPDRPLLIGSVKTNVGHLEAAAGVTGFIKATLAIQRGRIPANLHFDTPNPHIPFEELGLKVVDQPTNWPTSCTVSGQPRRPRRAAVSSFGFGGTNAHLVLEQPPAPASQRLHLSGAPVSTLVVSGKTRQRVAGWAGALAEWIEDAGAVVPLADIAHTLNHHRSRQDSFATVAARTREQAIAGLRALAADRSALGVVAPRQGSIGPGTVFVYSGRGSQWAGMGRELLADEPAFAAAIAELEPDFVAQVGFSLHDVIASGKELVGIEQIQLGLIGIQLALTALWRSYGVQPDVVIGHSMGEVAAAVVAGALTPAEGLRVTATRARLMAPLSGQGAMALLELDAAATEALIANHPQVSLGVYASPRQTVISGPPQLIDTLVDKVRQQNCFASRVSIEVAPHNPAMDALQPQMRSELADLTPRPPTIPIISTTYPDLDRPPTFDAEHWAANLRNPVRFQQAIAHAFSGQGGSHHTFIEISPHPLLTHSISDTLKGTYDTDSYLSIGTLQRDADDALTFRTNLNTAHATVPPRTPHPPEPHPVLPTTPWQHTNYWITTAPALEHPGSNRVSVNPTVSGNTELDGWTYRLEWPVLPLPSGPRAGIASSGSWLVVSDQGLSDELTRVADPGSRVEFLAPPALDDDATRLHSLLDGVDNVLYAPPVAAGPVDVESAYLVFHAARRLAAAMIATDSKPKLIVLTRNAQPVTEGERANPAHAVLWGLGRTLALEHPEIWGGVIDLDEAIPSELAARYVLDEAAGIDGEDQVVYRSGVRRAPRLQRRTAAAASVTLSENTSQLVIGATGNIGPHLVRQLAAMGATTIVAVSRNPGARLAELIESLAALGTNLIPVAADATDPTAMTALFDRFGVDLPPLEGIYLAAFGGRPVLLGDMTDEDVAAMFRPKLDAARLLHRLSLKHPVKHFVSFSSISGLIGSRWLAHYTATSAFLDTLGYARRLMGLPATVVAWGLWKSLADTKQDAAQVSAQSGLQPMADDVAIGALPLAMGPDAGMHSVVVAADWPLLATAYRTRGALRIVDDLLPAPGDAPVPESTNRLFALEWEPAPLDKLAGTASALLLIGDPAVDDPLLPALQSSLRARLAEVELVSAGDEVKLRAAITGTGWDGIVVVCPRRAVDESLPDRAQLELAQGRTLLIATVAETVKRMGARISPRLWIVTRGAQQVDPTESVTLAQTGLRGIARVLTFEHPELKPTLVDIEPEGVGALGDLIEELLAGCDQDEIAYRDGQRYVNRLVPAPTTAKGDLAAESRRTAPPPQPLVSRDGGYVIVGGMGGLGFVFARWLAEQGAGLIVLNGRSAPSDEVAAAIADLTAAGHRIEVITGDIAEAGTAEALVQAVDDAGFRPAGVLHSAMVLADETVLKMTESAAERVFAPKVTGGWQLHQASAARDVDWWLTFSSAASLLGAPGQGAQAAANSWVDGLVAHRRSAGLPAVGINWGPWAEVGRAQSFADLGVSTITAEEGLAAMQTVLAADRARTGVFSLDARQWFQSFPAVAGSSLFAKLHDSATLRSGEPRGAGAIRVQLDALDATERPGCLASAIADEVRGVLRSSDPIDHDRPLETLGLDSLMGIELRNRLEASLGITLPAALVWAYPTITDLADALCERMGYTVAANARETSDAEAELSEEEMDLLSDLVEAGELEAATKGES